MDLIGWILIYGIFSGLVITLALIPILVIWPTTNLILFGFYNLVISIFLRLDSLLVKCKIIKARTFNFYNKDLSLNEHRFLKKMRWTTIWSISLLITILTMNYFGWIFVALDDSSPLDELCYSMGLGVIAHDKPNVPKIKNKYNDFVGEEFSEYNNDIHGDPGIHNVEPHYVDDYTREDGTEVEGYWRGGEDGYERSNPDDYDSNNLGSDDSGDDGDFFDAFTSFFQ